MPYKIKKRGDKWAVVGPEGKVFGRHTSHKKAQAQVAALHIHVKESDVDDIVDHLLGERRPILTHRTFKRTLKKWLETKNEIDKLAALVEELREKNEPLVERLIPVIATLEDQKVRVDEGIVALQQRTDPKYRDAFAFAIQKLEELGLDKVVAQCQRHKKKLDEVRRHLVLYRRKTEEQSWWSRLTERVKDIAGRLWSFVKGWEPRVAAFEEAAQFMEPDGVPEGGVQEYARPVKEEDPEILKAIGELEDLADQYAGDFYGTVPGAAAAGLRDLVADYAYSNPEAPVFNSLDPKQKKEVIRRMQIPESRGVGKNKEIRVEGEAGAQLGTITVLVGPDPDAESGWSADPDDLPAELLGIIQKTYPDDVPDHTYRFNIELASSQEANQREPEIEVLKIRVQLPDGTRQPVKNWVLYNALEQWAMEDGDWRAVWRGAGYAYAEGQGQGVEHLVDELLMGGKGEGD